MPKRVSPKGKAAPPPQAETPAPAKKTAAKPRTKKTTSEATPQVYLRNIRGIAVRCTLDSGRRIELQPRGQRGDLAALGEDEHSDSKVIENVGWIWEPITQEEAHAIFSKQGTNSNQNVGSIMDIIRNPKGEAYENEAVVEKPFEQQGIDAGTVSEKGDIQRAPGAPPERVELPGTNNFPIPDVPSDVPPDQVSDYLARNAGEDAGDALRSSLRVSVQPTQRET